MKMIARLFLFAFLTGPAGFLYAQREAVDTPVFQRIRTAELNSSQIPMIAHYLTDVSGSRLTNSPGFKRAGTWAIESMKKWGRVQGQSTGLAYAEGFRQHLGHSYPQTDILAEMFPVNSHS